MTGAESGEKGSVERILLAHSIVLSTGGIPLLYLGDEVGQLNDYSYMNDPSKWDDSRWVNRPMYPQQRYDEAKYPRSDAGKIFAGFQQLLKLRKNTPELGGGRLIGFHTHNPAVLGYQRPGIGASIICLVNFSDDPEWVGGETLKGVPETMHDLVSGADVQTRLGIQLKSHQYMWLKF